ncbi:hypothetical protein GBAR_LOCUS19225 [Geodia barretti]|uniref:Uncharacterized protein n=1 Tax=Geodia barretti TaxID=519541 RepID=A0AA35SSD2_GEOBA|nr:hypothetical protein GBAR_LOCUS19225 [Geodia barretti]
MPLVYECQRQVHAMKQLIYSLHYFHYCSKSRAVGSLMWYEHAHNHFSKQYFQMWCPMKIASIEIGQIVFQL